MNTKKPIPNYFITRKNTILQILFTSLFAYIFINIYQPFGSGKWFNITGWEFSFYSGLLVIAGMLVVLVSRIFLMFMIKRRNPVSIRYYILMVFGEILFMGALYAFLQKVVMHDYRSYLFLLSRALENTALILLIPYIISLLFFAWKEKTISFNNLLQQIRNNSSFISFHDEKGVLRISLKTNNLLYLQSLDNYVSVKYLQNNQPKTVLIRNTLKNISKEFDNTILLRCHRSYMVNVNRVIMVKKEGNNLKLQIECPNGNVNIPVSRGYAPTVKQFFEGHQ
ncbi:LytR/AlgR family response regulator transcription factor [Thermophagus sp. OGC60D27]|uniref:LytR/AlgR family response regulator transcription factor n=1 Tax=Thermophagus sp. OGC60D27 TaxID=3458415 RepID=UPI004037C223